MAVHRGRASGTADVAAEGSARRRRARERRGATAREDGRRRVLVAGAIALAGVGLAGLSTAVASAAWTDQTWFTTAAASGTADLQGSVDGSTWLDSDDAGEIELVLPAIEDLRPGDSRALTLRVRNAGSLVAELTGSVAVDGALFAGDEPATAVLSGLPAQVAGGATVTGTLRIEAPEWTGFAHQGESGDVTVSIVGAVP